MQLLFEFLPIVVFFVVYKVNGIYAATIAAILMSFFQVMIQWYRTKKIDSVQLGILAIIILLGGTTVIFHDPIYIKLKPTVVNWFFAVIFLVSHYVGKTPLIQRMVGKKIDLPQPIWRALNLSWIIFFTFIGAANLYIAYHCSTNTWVNFKLFGVFGMTIVFIIVQSVYLSKHLKL